MKEAFQKIWDLALPYQDKRDDEGHAERVLNYALELLKIEGGNEDIVIPAAILHDIGWSEVTKEERMLAFRDEDVEREKIIELKEKHQKLGVKLAEEILKNVNYDERLIKEILEIISAHDTREGFISKNEGIIRDADKLDRFSKDIFWIDIKRHDSTKERRYEKLKSNINKQNYFYSEAAKKIAAKSLEEINKEF